ncbi:MAG: AMP-binding protein, partial [Alicyclobacillaceae bacterium]|nr:AMP-binding protein [Alicyclobacillaceae bacterium]
MSGAWNTTISEAFRKTVEQVPEQTAIVFGDRRMSYRDLSEFASAFAKGCLQLGLQKGDRVVLCLPNWPEFVVAYLAFAQTGLVCVPVNPRYSASEIEYIVQNSGARAAVFPGRDRLPEYEPIFRSCKEKFDDLEYIIPVGAEVEGQGSSFDKVLELGRSVAQEPRSAVTPDDLVVIGYTSGTTGVPKGAMLAHRNLMFSSTALNEVLQLGPKDVTLVVVPVCHIFGFALTLMSVISGAKIVLMERFEVESVFAAIERERVTFHSAVSTMFILELNHPNRSKYDLSSLRTGIIAAAPCPTEVVERIRTELGLQPIMSWGMTEASPALTASNFEQESWVYSTVGRALPGVELRVVDETGKVLGPGEIGELVCKSPGLMLGYYRNPEATRQAIDEEGWFHTGDLGSIDERGYVTIVGRKKEMISRGGLKIYPREVEERLYQHPMVEEAAVIGLPDPVLGERSCACIKLKPNAVVSVEELREYCSKVLADYKVPDVIEILPELPLNSSGKIYKLRLIEMMKEKYPPVY